MKAQLVICRDPIRPAHQRTVAEIRRGRRLRALAPRTQQPFICSVNGKWIRRAAWNRRVRDGDVVAFVLLPQGGGGSNPLRVILMIAVAMSAPYLGSAILGINGAAALGSLGVGMFNAAIGLTGMAIVNALIPAPKPTLAQQSSALSSPSPTYSIGAQGNQARLGQPVPVIYGRHVVYPDFAAMPYAEYSGNEQFLYQLFCIGQGEYTIESINIDDTPITSFSEITYEEVGPGESVTLFPTAVETSINVAGQEAIYNVALGPFVVNSANTDVNYIGIDVVCPRGLYYANDGGGLDSVSVSWKVEAQEIDDNGTPVGSYVTLGTPTLSAATTTPQRKSYKYAVTAKRYQVKLTRTTTKQTDARYGHELDWAGLRGYLLGSKTYGNTTCVAMRMQATNNLSQAASRKINMVVQRKLPTWNPTTEWSASAVATRSIAWALADICAADYGAALADARIDLQGLYDLDAVWSARGDTFDGIFDSQSTIMEALSQVARAGRAIPYLQGGIVHFARDAAATIPVGMFSQRNIVKNSLSLEYLMPTEETSDCLDVEYFDEAIWAQRTVRASLPGGTVLQPAQVKLFGVTSRQQAWNEGMYAVACNRYRRRMVAFSTEMEGFIPSLADLIAIQHDMPQWGQSGEIVSWSAETKTATLSEPLDWSQFGIHKLAFRKRDGSVAGPYDATEGEDAYHVTLSGWETGDPTPDTGSDRERAHFAFGLSAATYILARVLAVKPRSSETVEISAVVESDYVHTADTGAAPGVSAWQLPTRWTKPVLVGLTARSMPDYPEQMILSWQPSVGADRYLVEQSSGDGNWTRVGEVAACNFTGIAVFGAQTVLRVAAIGLTRSDWVEIQYGQSASYFWSGTNSAAFWTTDATLMWAY